jgi:hypothetical protein
VWDHLAGTKSTPFEGGEQGQIAGQVIDDYGASNAFLVSLVSGVCAAIVALLASRTLIGTAGDTRGLATVDAQAEL